LKAGRLWRYVRRRDDGDPTAAAERRHAILDLADEAVEAAELAYEFAPGSYTWKNLLVARRLRQRTALLGMDKSLGHGSFPAGATNERGKKWNTCSRITSAVHGCLPGRPRRTSIRRT
jgi:hypothetical protein